LEKNQIEPASTSRIVREFITTDLDADLRLQMPEVQSPV